MYIFVHAYAYVARENRALPLHRPSCEQFFWDFAMFANAIYKCSKYSNFARRQFFCLFSIIKDLVLSIMFHTPRLLFLFAQERAFFCLVLRVLNLEFFSANVYNFFCSEFDKKKKRSTCLSIRRVSYKSRSIIRRFLLILQENQNSNLTRVVSHTKVYKLFSIDSLSVGVKMIE